MFKKIGIGIILLLAICVQYTSANSIEDLRFEDGLFSGYFSGIQYNQSDVNFVYNGNNFGGIFFFKGLETLATGEIVSLSGVNKTCTQKILGLYYNSQRGNRLRPLDQQSLSGLKLLDTGYNDLYMTGGLFVGCSGDTQSVYGNITHIYGNVTLELIAGTDYNFVSNSYLNIYSGSLKFIYSRASGYIYDNYGGIAKISGTGNIIQSGSCGNGIIEMGEICDDGLYNGQASYCNISCTSNSSVGLGGGVRLIKDNCKYNSKASNLSGANSDGIDNSPSYYDRTCLLGGEGNIHGLTCSVKGSSYSQELNSAFQYNYNLGTTTVCPRSEARLDKYILRKELAKMMSIYAMKVVGLNPQSGKKGCADYGDISDESQEMKMYMKLSCELNLMGLHTDGKTPKKNFDPNDFLTRAEFGTVFSRLLYGSKYNGTKPRYYEHLRALRKADIMTKIDEPFEQELRGYIMIMLRRADKDGILQIR